MRTENRVLRTEVVIASDWKERSNLTLDCPPKSWRDSSGRILPSFVANFVASLLAMTAHKISFSVLCTLFSVLFFSKTTHACPLCKEAVEKMGQVWTSLGFNFSIYFMIAIPFLLVAGFAAALYLNYRKRGKHVH